MPGSRLLAFAFAVLIACAVAAAPRASATPSPTPSPVPSLQAQATDAAFTAAIAKSRADALTSSLSQATIVSGAIKNVVVDASAAILALLALILLWRVRERIVDAVTNGAFTLSLGPFGQISIAAKVAAMQQKTQPAPPAPDATPDRHGIAAKDHGKAFIGKSVAHDDADIDAYYATFYSALFASQFLVLDRARNNPNMTVADARIIYDAANARATRLPFEDWIGYLERYGMIAVSGTKATARIAISQRGSDFLAWARSHHYDAAALAADGRSY